MANVRSARVLLEPDEYEHLEEIASRRGVSVGELILGAVRERFLPAPRHRLDAADAICRLSIPIGDWEGIEDEIAEAHEP
jgi:hypothetical protein